MEIRIKSVHFDASEKLVEFINKKANRLVRHNDEIIDINVSLSVVKPETAMNKEALVKVATSSAGDFVATKTADTFEEAIDLALDALDRQMAKKKESR